VNIVKSEIRSLLDRLPDTCTFEDVQYHLYVVEKIHRGLDRAEKEGAQSQDEVERKFRKWMSE